MVLLKAIVEEFVVFPKCVSTARIAQLQAVLLEHVQDILGRF